MKKRKPEQVRRVFVLREQEVLIEQIRKGDVFKITEGRRVITGKHYQLSMSKAKPGKPVGNYTVQGISLPLRRVDDLGFVLPKPRFK